MKEQHLDITLLHGPVFKEVSWRTQSGLCMPSHFTGPYNILWSNIGFSCIFLKLYFSNYGTSSQISVPRMMSKKRTPIALTDLTTTRPSTNVARRSSLLVLMAAVLRTDCVFRTKSRNALAQLTIRRLDPAKRLFTRQIVWMEPMWKVTGASMTVVASVPGMALNLLSTWQQRSLLSQGDGLEWRCLSV